jgi:hypothetical protein
MLGVALAPGGVLVCCMFRNGEATLAGQCPIDTYATPEILMMERPSMN